MPPRRKTPSVPLRRTKKAKKSLALPPPPPPFRFQGARLKFLKQYVADFLALAAGPVQKLWFDNFIPLYWAEFPWRLPIDQDPYVNMPSCHPTDVLDADEICQRAYILARTNVRIRSFFHHARLMRARQLA
ncbi:hypothetical protein B0H11DRAFT_2251837 [Mycena galericulata]|nr:hypothetical protein B0H11DRAFT_2251837 [Mycena galericulata]